MPFHKVVTALYDNIFLYYDNINSLLTLGLAKYWRRKSAFLLEEKFPNINRILDICCGTGEFTIELFKVYKEKVYIVGVDLNENMLSLARKKTDKIFFKTADVSMLPFEDENFDAVTISFATRNIAIDKQYFSEVLKEIKRVLKKRGIFLNLETIVPENRVVKFFMFFYIKAVTGLLGLVKPDMKKAYSFLRNSIQDFYTVYEFCEVLKSAGFDNITYKILCPGAVCVHMGMKGE